MPYTRYLPIVAVLIGTVPWQPAAAEPGEPEATVVEPSMTAGILVLRNGGVIAGKVERLADQYRVTTADSELTLRAEQVEMFCQSMDEVYQRRRFQRTGSTADSHLDLAQWCMRNGMLEYASRELLDARTLDPRHRRLVLVERQLQLALKNREGSKGHRARSFSKKLPTDEDMNRVAEVPAWAKKIFVRQIQPLLVDSCATSGCHHSGSQETFQLNRVAMDGAGHPGTTLRNLAATVKQVDWRQPENSVLLAHAARPHGGSEALRPAELERHQYQLLLSWVAQMAEAKRNAPVREIQLAEHQQSDSLDALPRIRQALLEEDSAEKDPFDPAQFNQRQASDP